MTVIHAQVIGDQVLLPLPEWERIIEIAQRSEKIAIQPPEDDPSSSAWMKFIEMGGAFDFWKEPGEDIYSLEDGEPV